MRLNLLENGMTKVVLHVGMPKCASSSIQAHFADHYQTYCGQGLLYPKTGRETKGYRSHRPLHHASAEEYPELLKQIADEAREQRCRNILLSSEELANSRIQKSDTQALIRSLQNLFGSENVEILFLIRDHLSFIRSSFAQYLKGGLFRVSDADFFARDVPSIRTYADCFFEKNQFEVFSFSAFFQQFQTIANGARINLMSIKEPNMGPLLKRVCELFDAPFVGEDTRQNERFSQHQLFCLLHARKKYGREKTKAKRRFLAKGMIADPEFHSSLFDVDASLAERLTQTAIQDLNYFKPFSDVYIATAFSADAKPTCEQDSIEVPENLLRFIDRIMEIEDLKMPRAKRVGKRFMSV